MPNTVPDTTTSARIVHVAVAVIVNNGRVLIARRPEHVHQGGLWEFPGGKVEPNESVTRALAREIREELGIDITSSRPLIRIVHHYTDKSVLLETRLVSEYAGKDYARDQGHAGLEGQEVRWVAIADLHDYRFPEANRAIINAIQLPEQYAITPDYFADAWRNERQDSVPAAMEAFLQDFRRTAEQSHLLQLRIKSLQGRMLEHLVRQTCGLAQEHNARVLLNSAMPVSEASHKLASGIHLITAHLHDNDFVAGYRRRYPGKLIAASCHNQQDIRQANALSVDFLVLSPVQRTLSHPEQAALGWKRFQQYCDYATMPVYALGGMVAADVITAQAHGGQGIAAIRSLWHVVTNEEPRLEK